MLLKYLLYNRIVKVMDDRQKRIASRLDEAERKKQEAEQEAENYRKKTQEFEKTREEKLAEVEEEVESRHKQLLTEARQEVEDQKRQWEKALEREKEDWLNHLRQASAEHVYTIARRIMQDLANTDLERHIITKFIERLKHLEDEEQETLTSLKQASQKTLEVRSAFDIPKPSQQNIKRAVGQFTSEKPSLQFTTDPDVIGGIELSTDGHKISWSICSYLDSLEQEWKEAIMKPATETEEDQKALQEKGENNESA
jgi:F-type H+-transporting ATPase subunit b